MHRASLTMAVQINRPLKHGDVQWNAFFVCNQYSGLVVKMCGL